MTSYRYLGYGTTNSNGVAHLEINASGQEVGGYVGTGAGEVDVIASLDNPISQGSIVSVPCNVLDCLYYDKALSGDGNHNDAMWYEYYSTLERGSDGSVFTANGEWGEIRVGTTSSAQAITLPIVVEFDLLEMSEIGDTGPYVSIKNFNSNNYWYIVEELGHHRLEVRSNSQTQTVNGVSKPDGSVNLGESIRFGMGSTTAGGTIKFKNLKIYPL